MTKRKKFPLCAVKGVERTLLRSRSGSEARFLHGASETAINCIVFPLKLFIYKDHLRQYYDKLMSKYHQLSF